MSYTRSYFHIVFSTKYRQRTIQMDRRSRLYAYMTKTIQNKKSDLIKINGMENHIHILLDLHSTVALAEMVKTIKQTATEFIKKTFVLPMFEGWASEYYACSVSPSHVPAVKQYIQNQEEHHSQKNFENEMEEFVKKMGMTLYKDEF